jgi:hypothetical protein
MTELWARARIDLRMTDSEIGDHSIEELTILFKRHNEMEMADIDRLDTWNAMLCTLIHNSNCKPEKKVQMKDYKLYKGDKGQTNTKMVPMSDVQRHIEAWESVTRKAVIRRIEHAGD